MKNICKVDQHGSHHLELELTYPLPVGQKKSKYVVDIFLFTPVSLGLVLERNGVQGFLNNVKSYVRYGLCTIPFSKMLDPSCDISPLIRIRRMLQDMVTARDLDTQRVLYELKILANLHHDEIAAQRGIFRRQLNAGVPESVLREYLNDCLRDSRAFAESMRALYSDFMDPRISEEVRLALQMVDEAVSIKTEKELHRICSACERVGVMTDVVARIEQYICEEEEYRKRMGFASIAGPDFSLGNESYVYRESNLKKWSQSATYMTREMAKTPVRIGHILASIAAAIAMAFAVAAALIAQNYYAMNSLPWAVLIVLAYMLKDRIKEVSRNMLIKLVPTLVADRIVKLIDPQGNRNVGRNRERVRFCTSETIPEDVMQMRMMKSDTFRASMPAEPVIHFSKTMILNGKKLLSNHQRLSSLMEIIRINLGSWLEEMDDPVDELFSMHNGRREIVKTNRVYHANLVVRSGLDDGTSAQLFKYRIILTRSGIERIESIR